MQTQENPNKHESFHPIHQTINSALAAITNRAFGVYIPGAINFLKMLNFTCSTCNAYRTWTYEAEMGNKYTKMHTSIGPFKEISMDPLGPCTVKSFPGSRKRIKIWPLMIKCINSGAITIYPMESMDTKQVILCLLRLETRYGELIGISRDSGTNLLNLNPKTEDGKRLFNLIRDYTAPVDSQYRNYIERNAGMIKRYLRQACGVEKNGNIPTVLKSELDYLLDLTCAIINKIPYCVTKGNAMVTLAPADMLFRTSNMNTSQVKNQN